MVHALPIFLLLIYDGTHRFSQHIMNANKKISIRLPKFCGKLMEGTLKLVSILFYD